LNVSGDVKGNLELFRGSHFGVPYGGLLRAQMEIKNSIEVKMGIFNIL